MDKRQDSIFIARTNQHLDLAKMTIFTGDDCDIEHELKEIIKSDTNLFYDIKEFSYKSSSYEFIKKSNPFLALTRLLLFLKEHNNEEDKIYAIFYPEEHLHPKYQKHIGIFLCKLVSFYNKRILIFTHSDHIINMVCYDQYNGFLKSWGIKIYNKSNDKKSLYEKIEILNGQFYNRSKNERGFPEGFFDATLKEVMEINQ